MTWVWLCQSLLGSVLNHLFHYTTKNISVEPLFNLHSLSLFQLPFTRSKIAQFMEYPTVIIALNHQGYFWKHFVEFKGKTMHSVLSTSAQNLRHSLTQWITYLSLTRTRNAKPHTRAHTHKIKLLRCVMFKKDARTHWSQWTRLVTCGKGNSRGIKLYFETCWLALYEKKINE